MWTVAVWFAHFQHDHHKVGRATIAYDYNELVLLTFQLLEKAVKFHNEIQGVSWPAFLAAVWMSRFFCLDKQTYTYVPTNWPMDKQHNKYSLRALPHGTGENSYNHNVEKAGCFPVHSPFPSSIGLEFLSYHLLFFSLCSTASVLPICSSHPPTLALCPPVLRGKGR